MNIGSITIKSCAKLLESGEAVLDKPITNAEVLAEILKHGGWSSVILEKDEDKWFIQGDAGPNSVIRTLGVFWFGNGEDHIQVWVVNRRRTIMELPNVSRSVTLEVECDGQDNLSNNVGIPLILDTIKRQIAKHNDGYVYAMPNPDDCILLTGFGGRLPAIDTLGVYKLAFTCDVYTTWNVWIVKKTGNKKMFHELLRSGKGDDAHYLLSLGNCEVNKQSMQICRSRDEARAFATNAINIEIARTSDNELIEDIGLRFDPLESFFRNAKPGDHGVLYIDDKDPKAAQITIVRLRNEIQ